MRVNTEFAVVRIDKFLGGGIARYLAPVLNHDWTVWRMAPPMSGDGLTLPLVFGILLRVDSTWGRGGGATGHNSTLSRAVLGRSHRCTMSVGVAWCSNAREKSENEKKNERKMKKRKEKNKQHK